MIQAGADARWDALAERLDAAYYALTRTTHRHFGERHEGWFLTGVQGLDAPTMNRAVVQEAEDVDAQRVIDAAESYFGGQGCSWSVVLSSFRPAGRWHPELVMRGLSPTTTLDVLARAPGPLAGAAHAPDIPVRLARSDETALFTDILMEVFRMPRRFYPALLDMTDAWRRAGARLYFGLDEEGTPVSTTLVAVVDGVAGVYNVGTRRKARRKGHATALMARALEDARGADVVTLQVAPEGFTERFYLDLGFEPVYHWRFYTPRPRLPFLGR